MPEIEGRCPICGTVMDAAKGVAYKDRAYTLPFPLFLCQSHYHGWFRWVGSKHKRFRFPDDLNLATRSESYRGSPNRYAEALLVKRKCTYCKNKWEELDMGQKQTSCFRCNSDFPV